MRQQLGRPKRGAERYVTWRVRCLVNAGFEASQATRVACDTGYDLHALLELVDRGCPPELAVRILAPLDLREPV